MRHPATSAFCDPDLTGPAGDAWKIDLPATPRTPDGTATLSGWQLTIPGAHPFWHSYGVSVAHLREIPGAKLAVKHYPEAAYEVIIVALDPDRPMSDPKTEGFKIHLLTPPNLAQQFHGVSDGQAQGLARALAAEFVAGRLSPDTDFRSNTAEFVRRYVERFGGSVG